MNITGEFMKCGAIDIGLPTADMRRFWISENLAELLGVEYQSEAVSILKHEIKNHTNIKLRPNIDYEADSTLIDSRSADTILIVAEIINNLTVNEHKIFLSSDEKTNLLKILKMHKIPKAKKWKVGDIFNMKLADGTFMFGQVVGTHLTGLSPTCAVFELRKQTEELISGDLMISRVISIQNTDGECLINGKFRILFNENPLVCTDGTNKNFSTDDMALLNLCNAYCGLEPWNVLYREGYFDDMLCDGIYRPKTALILDKEARDKYRLEHFGINDHNEYVNKGQ